MPASVYTPSPVAPESQVEIKPLEAPAPTLNSADKVFEPDPVAVAPVEPPAEPAAPAPAPVDDSLVEFIELIPLEIEDLPSTGA